MRYDCALGPNPLNNASEAVTPRAAGRPAPSIRETPPRAHYILVVTYANERFSWCAWPRGAQKFSLKRARLCDGPVTNWTRISLLWTKNCPRGLRTPPPTAAALSFAACDNNCGTRRRTSVITRVFHYEMKRDGGREKKKNLSSLACMMALLILILCVLVFLSPPWAIAKWILAVASTFPHILYRVMKIKTLESNSFSPGHTRFMCHQH